MLAWLIRVPNGSYARTYAPESGRSYAPSVPAIPFPFPGGLGAPQPTPTHARVAVVDGVIFQLQHEHPLGIARVWTSLLPPLVARLRAQGTRVVSALLSPPLGSLTAVADCRPYAKATTTGDI